LGTSFQIAKAEFKLKNEGSYLGIFWYLLSPLLTFIILFLVFSDRLGGGIPNYAGYLLIGVIIFNFFIRITKENAKVILVNALLIKSVNFPRESLIIANLFNAVVSHLIEIVLFSFILAFFFGTNITGFLFYPLILIPLVIFAIGISFFLSAMTIYVNDLDNIWAFVTTLIWLGTPIFYEVGGQTKLLAVNLFNPLFYFITLAREVILYQRLPELNFMVGAVIFSAVSFFVGYFIFSRLNRKIAELI